MTQKQRIVDILQKYGSMTHRELSVQMYGDPYHEPNIQMSLQSLVKDGYVIREGSRPSYYSLSNNIYNQTFSSTNSNKEIKEKIMIKNIPTPSSLEVERYLEYWDRLEDYSNQEFALEKVFRGEFSSNTNIENILIKSALLNEFYSTNIFKIYPVAKHILNLNIDERLIKGDPTLVNDIAKIQINDKKFNFYSFASKYCSHHNELEYPIYDSYVKEVLKYFSKKDQFFRFTDKELLIYSNFKTVLFRFREFYKLEKYTLKELDKYLWQLGKEYFPKKY